MLNQSRFNKAMLPPPREYYPRYLTKLKGSGVQRTALCPFHDDRSPSFSVNMLSGAFICYGCDKSGGDVLAFHMLLFKLDFKVAAQELGAWDSNADVRTNRIPPPIDAKIIAHDKEMIEKRAKAKQEANRIWGISIPAKPNHPYLWLKGIQPFIARQLGNKLVLPITNIEGEITSLQYIHPNKFKELLRWGAKKGNFIRVNGDISNPKILICEGYATGASLANCYPNACVISAIDGGNLEPVAVSIRNRFPMAQITICADDDRRSEGNYGITKARAAALASGAFIATPQWPLNAPETLSDFNDLELFLKNAEVSK